MTFQPAAQASKRIGSSVSQIISDLSPQNLFQIDVFINDHKSEFHVTLAPKFLKAYSQFLPFSPQELGASSLRTGTGPRTTLWETVFGPGQGPWRAWGPAGARPAPRPLRRGGGFADSQPPAPFRGHAWLGKTHTPPTPESQCFLRVCFPTDWLSFQSGLQKQLSEGMQADPAVPHHSSYGMHLERGKNSTGVVIRFWTGSDMAWLEFQSWLLFAFVMKHLLYELRLPLLKQLLRETLNGRSASDVRWLTAFTSAAPALSRSRAFAALCAEVMADISPQSDTWQRTKQTPVSAEFHGTRSLSGRALRLWWKEYLIIFLNRFLDLTFSLIKDLQHGLDLSSREFLKQ